MKQEQEDYNMTESMKKKEIHNHYYYEEGRNGWTPDNTWQSNERPYINPKMLI